MTVRPLLALGVVALALSACQSGDAPSGPPSQMYLACMSEYHASPPDPMPAGSYWVGDFSAPTYAVPCQGLTDPGDGEWNVLVVAPDDQTIRIYFVGATQDSRCGLLRRVKVTEGTTSVNIQLEMGNDPSTRGSACTLAGLDSVTQIKLSSPLAGRTLTGRNNK